MSSITYELDNLGNLIKATKGNVSSGFVNIPEYNRVTPEDDQMVAVAKINAQKKIYEKIFESSY